MKFILPFVFSCIATLSTAQGVNVELLAHVFPGETCSNIWGYTDSTGLEYAVIGGHTATLIYSLEDPKKPQLRASIKGSTTIWREISVWKNHVYVATDQSQDGILIINMTNAPLNITHTFWQPQITIGNETEQLRSCHEIFIDEKGYCYLLGCNPGVGGAIILDLNKNPESPVVVGNINKRYIHDAYAKNDVLYSSDISAGLETIYDIRDRKNPVELVNWATSFNFTHNSWTNDNATFIWTTDERGNAFLDCYDISDLTKVKLVDKFQPEDTKNKGVIPHNTQYLNGWNIVSWYTDGVKIVDSHRPNNNIEVGSYDTWTGAHGGFHGLWGAYPYSPSGMIFGSDIESGLYIWKPTYVRASYLEGIVLDSVTRKPLSNVNVVFNTPTPSSRISNIDGVFRTGYRQKGTYTVSFNHPDYFPLTKTVSIDSAKVTDILAELVPKESVFFTVKVVDDKGNAIENARVNLESTKETLSSFTNMNGETAMRIFIDSLPLEIYAGKWGYKTVKESSAPIFTNKSLTLTIKKGYADDFPIDLGWTVESTSPTGVWTRGEPVLVQRNGVINFPDLDVPDDLGNKCYITGNRAGARPGDDDVDDGNSILKSPLMDLSTYNKPVFKFAKWFHNSGGTSTPNDKLVVKLTNGSTVAILDETTVSTTDWVKMTIPLDNLIPVSKTMQFIIEASDDIGNGHLFEAGIDAFEVYDAQPTASENPGITNVILECTPNPFIGETVLNYDIPHAKYIVMEIINIEGRVIEHTILPSSKGKIAIGKNLQTGVYLVSLTGDNGKTTSTQIIKN